MSQRVKERASAKTSDHVDHYSGSEIARAPTERPPLTEGQMEERRRSMVSALDVERSALSFRISVSGEDLAAAGFAVRPDEHFDLPRLISDAAYTGGAISQDMILFAAGNLSIVEIRISGNPRIAATQRETLEKIRMAISHLEGIYEIAPLEIDESEGSAILVNNWYSNFSQGQREELDALLLRAQSLDYDSMAAFLYVYDFLKTTVNQTGLAMASGLHASSQSGLLAPFLEASQEAQPRLLECMRGIADGSARRLQLTESAYLAYSSAQDAYQAAVGNISQHLAGIGEVAIDVQQLGQDVERQFPPIPSGLMPPEFSIYSRQHEFSEIERSLFNSVVERYESLRQTFLGMDEDERLAIAAAMAGMPPGTMFRGREVQAPNPNISIILGEYLAIGGVLSLFQAKARFNSILGDYIEYRKACEYLRSNGSIATGDRVLMFAAQGGFPQSINSEAVRRFLSNREGYVSELRGLGERLQGYGEFIQNTLVREMSSSGFLELYSTEQLENLFSRIKDGIPGPAAPDERIADPDEIAMLFGPLSEYLSGLAYGMGNVEEASQELASQQYDWNLMERFRNGDFWDKAYSFSKYFMKYGASDFIFLASLATLGVGTLARGATIGLDFLLGAAGRGAIRRAAAALANTTYRETLAIAYRQATTATAIAGAPVWINAMRYFGGNRSNEVYQDLNIAGLYLLMRRGAGFDQASMFSRSFAAGSAALGTAAAGARLVEDIRRGERLQALADSVVFATGGALFVKSVSGIMRFRDAASAGSGTVSAATAAGLGEISFGRIGETALNWASLGYTSHGFMNFYGLHTGFQAIRNLWLTIPALSIIYEEGGIGALREYINSSYVEAGNFLPLASIVFSGAIEGGRFALGRVRPAQRIQLSEFVPGQDPRMTITAARIGATETAEQQIASRGIVLDRNAAMAIRRHALTAPSARQSEDALIAELGLAPEQVSAARNAIREMNLKLDQIWDDVGLLTSETPVSPARAAELAGRLERVEQLRSLASAGRAAGIGAVAVGAVTFSINHELPRAREIVDIQERVVEHMNSLGGGSAYFMDALASGAYPGMGRRRFSPSFIWNFSVTMAEILREMGAGSYEGYDWSAFTNAFPDEKTRMNAIMAVFLSLASHGRAGENPLAVSDYRLPVFNFASRLRELSEAGMDLSGMGVSDMFFLAEYYLSGGDSSNKVRQAYNALRVLEGLSGAALDVDFDPVNNPQASRVISAAASYAIANEKNLDWVVWAASQILTCCRPEQMGYWSAEMMYAMFSSEIFESPGSMPQDPLERVQALVQLWYSLGQSDPRFPWNIYYPDEMREIAGE